MRSALFLPIFDPLAEPATVARLSAEAEEVGWHGVFVRDHVRWREPVMEVADAWIPLAAVATTTRRIRLGPMVTTLARRRPVKVARETATLDRLSGGRLTLGVGLGNDQRRALHRRSSPSSPRCVGRGQGPCGAYDVVAALPPGRDPAPNAAAGATWWLVEFPSDGVSVDQVRGAVRDGPTPPP